MPYSAIIDKFYGYVLSVVSPRDLKTLHSGLPAYQPRYLARYLISLWFFVFYKPSDNNDFATRLAGNPRYLNMMY